MDGNYEKKVTLTPPWIHFMRCVQRAGNNAQERRQSEPQGVKQKCGSETLRSGEYMAFIECGCGRKLAKENIYI